MKQKDRREEYKINLIKMIRQYQQSACCMHSMRKADRLWSELKNHLTESEKNILNVERDHHNFGHEGREIFDSVCDDIINRIELGLDRNQSISKLKQQIKKDIEVKKVLGAKKNGRI